MLRMEVGEESFTLAGGCWLLGLAKEVGQSSSLTRVRQGSVSGVGVNG